MKNKESHKSGAMKQNGIVGLPKGQTTCARLYEARITEYNKSPRLCLECETPLSYKQRRYKCCSHSCSAKASNRARSINGFVMPQSATKAIADKLIILQSIKKLDRIAQYEKSPKICKNCGSNIPYIRKSRVTCSDDCGHQLRVQYCRKAGLKSAAGPRAKRSKNEIKFYDLCAQHFKSVTHNDPIFDGWDADVLIHDFKIAVLWNGDWHYKEMGCYNHSLTQVQNRDAHKHKLIEQHGWHAYIVKDTSDSPTKPADALHDLKAWILTNKI